MANIQGHEYMEANIPPYSTDLREYLSDLQDETTVLTEKLNKAEELVAQTHGDVKVERNLRLALAAAFDDLARLLREALSGVAVFNAAAAASQLHSFTAAKNTQHQLPSSSTLPASANKDIPHATPATPQKLPRAHTLYTSLISTVISPVASPWPSASVTATAPALAAPPPATDLAADAVSPTSEKALIGALVEFARKMEDECRPQLQALEAHKKLLPMLQASPDVGVSCATSRDVTENVNEDARAMLVVMREEEEKREEVRGRERAQERAQERQIREELGKSVAYLDTVSLELADAATREQQLSNGLAHMAQDCEALQLALQSRDASIAALLEEQRGMRERDTALSREVAEASAALAAQVAAQVKFRDSLAYVRWVLAGRVLPQVIEREGEG